MHSFEQKLEASWPPAGWSDVTVLVAVSGGPDSMALFHAMQTIRRPESGRLIVIHFNHRLRGAESDADESFVREQAVKRNCICVVEQAESTNSVAEEEARNLRYDFFCRTAKEWGARFVLTAHTADDQAETILHRILRGTGLDGLAGIPKSRQLIPGVSLVRPMLAVTREDVFDYLHSIDQASRQDSTNAESGFTRNRLRNQLIPLLEQDYNPRVKAALIRLGQLAAESQELVAESVSSLRDRCVIIDRDNHVTIRCDELSQSHLYAVRQMLMDVWRDCGWGFRNMSLEHWQQLADLATANFTEQRCMTFPGNVQVERHGVVLRIHAG